MIIVSSSLWNCKRCFDIKWVLAVKLPDYKDEKQEHHLKKSRVDRWRKRWFGIKILKKNCLLFKRSIKVIQRQNEWVTSCILKTCGQALWPALLQTPRRSWSLLLRLPAPGREAHRWLFQQGCRPQRAAALDASQNHITLCQRPDRWHQLVTNMYMSQEGGNRETADGAAVKRTQRIKLTRMVWDAMLCAKALGIPIFTAPSARASANRYTCGEQTSLPSKRSVKTFTISQTWVILWLTKATPLPLIPVWMSIHVSGPSSTKPQWCNKERSRAPSSGFAWDPRANSRAPSWTKQGRFGIILITTVFSGRSCQLKGKNMRPFDPHTAVLEFKKKNSIHTLTSSNVARVTPAAIDTIICRSVTCCEISLRTCGTRWGLTATKTTSDSQTTSALEWVTGTPSSWNPKTEMLPAFRNSLHLYSNSWLRGKDLRL